MKKTILIIFTFLSSLTLFSQTNANLDKKNGFNKFKLGSNTELHKKNLKYFAKNKDNVTFYYYIGSDIQNVFNVKIDKILLGYYKNKLYTISIDFGVLNDSVSGKLIRELEKIFGDVEIETNEKSETFEYEWVAAWSTDNIHMQINKMSCSFEFKPCSVSIFLNSKKIEQEIQNDKF
ncbi:hypothetical protein [Flavobacterium sp.]|uniref:hypothetical protein n=1 Tax=Flavobacterium sp. TaxID=239 RepID=UPI002627FB42|nr:hypothetical protein [Flavobacterium sp.]